MHRGNPDADFEAPLDSEVAAAYRDGAYLLAARLLLEDRERKLHGNRAWAAKRAGRRSEAPFPEPLAVAERAIRLIDARPTCTARGDGLELVFLDREDQSFTKRLLFVPPLARGEHRWSVAHLGES